MAVARLAADMGFPLNRVARRTRHHHLDGPLGVVGAVPFGAQFGDGVVQVHGYPAAHGDNHGLAGQDVLALVPMVQYVRSQLFHPFGGTDQGFQLRPAGFDALSGFLLVVFGDFLEGGIDDWTLIFGKIEAHQATFIENRNGSPIIDGPLNVVDVDVVPEDHTGILVVQFQRGAREGHEGGVGQCRPQIGRVSVQNLVLAALGLIDHDDDVLPFGQDGMAA
jgi:hypothetical protein